MAEQIRSLCILEKRVDNMAVETSNPPLPSCKAFEDITDIFRGLKELRLRIVRVAKRKGRPTAPVHGWQMAGY